ncbi:DUF4271 domain-containing protein [Flagellimonas hadalis]|uniref:DUF4271 domain-containing protein n=1 Tax=Flagellimonas hadalis TaxID=2597517 RepID=A0A5N5IKN1_9FLAO|nr:DUF4271 domain-containing protein [Allomuricauda hadalis]KAB5485072.1 DUF4271 domain-containing protein [Allomuricauda hadalis]RUA16408.1 MAG: DUF4271 domain-containing protein [Flavobacteriia bacterium]
MNPIEKVAPSLDWMTIVLFASLVVMALGKYMYHSRFLNFIILPFNDKYVLLHNKKGQLLNWFHILLTLFQVVNLSLFVFFVLKAFGVLPGEDPLWVFLMVLGGLVLFQLVKLGLQSFTGFVFNAQELIVGLIFSKTSYLNYSSIILFVANVILTYILKDSKTVIYSAFILILLINGIGAIKLLKNYQKAMFPYFMYFILYLCALEIAPLVLIGSYLKG